jgi:hypothetical protein
MIGANEGTGGGAGGGTRGARGAGGRAFVALLLVASGFAVGSMWDGAWTQAAFAEPPRPSALNLQRGGSPGDPAELLDAGAQRIAMIAELKAMRSEVADLRAMLSSGRVKVEVSNLGDAKLEIDYARLRDAMRRE